MTILNELVCLSSQNSAIKVDVSVDTEIDYYKEDIEGKKKPVQCGLDV